MPLLNRAHGLAVPQLVWMDVESCNLSPLPTNISKRPLQLLDAGKEQPLTAGSPRACPAIGLPVIAGMAAPEVPETRGCTRDR